MFLKYIIVIFRSDSHHADILADFYHQVLAEQMPEVLDFDKDLVHLEAASKVVLI